MEETKEKFYIQWLTLTIYQVTTAEKEESEKISVSARHRSEGEKISKRNNSSSLYKAAANS